MADKDIWGCAEDGTYNSTGPAVNLAGTVPSTYAIGQIFTGGMSDGETATITIRKDADNWAVYKHAELSTGSPDSFDLSGATLV